MERKGERGVEEEGGVDEKRGAEGGDVERKGELGETGVAFHVAQDVPITDRVRHPIY